MAEAKRTKVKKGWLVVMVGLEEEGDGYLQRFEIPISHLHHPLFKTLLDTAKEVYGYHSSGPVRLPCSVDDFTHLRWLVEREPQCSHGHPAGRRQTSFSLLLHCC